MSKTKDVLIKVSVGKNETTCQQSGSSVYTQNNCDTGVVVSPLDGCDCNIDPCACSESSNCSSAQSQGSNFPVAVVLEAAFNMPACGETADISVVDAERFTIGTLLYHPTVGYLAVISVPDNNTLTVKNECSDCNIKGPGELILSTTVFAVGIPACGDGSTFAPSSTTPFLATDFTIPASGNCASMKVTNVVGLFVGDLIAVNSLSYRISGIPNSTTLTVCNDGDGGTANEVIEADENSDSIPDFPVIRVGGQSPCTAEEVNSIKKIVGCNGADGQVGFIGNGDGQIPIWNDSSESWELQTLSIPITCVTLDSCLTLDPGAPADQSYLIDVLPNTDIFVEALAQNNPDSIKIYIDGAAFHIGQSGIIDANTIRVRPDDGTFASPIEFEVGSEICLAPCCEQCLHFTRATGLHNNSVPSGQEKEKLIVFGSAVTSFSIPGTGTGTGVTVVTYPSVVGSSGYGGSVGDGLWTLSSTNVEDPQGENGCQKLIQIYSNFECAIDLPGGVYANVEFRIVKSNASPGIGTLAGYALPFTGGRRNLAALNANNLLQGGNPGNFFNINTWKGFAFERDQVSPGEQYIYQGHIRIVFENTNSAAQNILFAGAWRAGMKLENYTGVYT